MRYDCIADDPIRPRRHALCHSNIFFSFSLTHSIRMLLFSGPVMVRLAWHDAGTFDKNIKAEWPGAGGANGM